MIFASCVSRCPQSSRVVPHRVMRDGVVGVDCRGNLLVRQEVCRRVLLGPLALIEDHLHPLSGRSRPSAVSASSPTVEACYRPRALPGTADHRLRCRRRGSGGEDPLTPGAPAPGPWSTGRAASLPGTTGAWVSPLAPRLRPRPRAHYGHGPAAPAGRGPLGGDGRDATATSSDLP